MTTKNAMHYRAVEPITDDTEIDSSSTNIDVNPQPEVPEISTSVGYSKFVSPRLFLSIFAVGFLLVLLSTLLMSPNNQIKEDSSIKTESFDRSQLYTLSRGRSETYCVGCSKNPAILLYKYYSKDIFSSSNVDDIYGHIPHQWINCEASFLLVDQITKGVGM
jgi:hypothetical protein